MKKIKKQTKTTKQHQDHDSHVEAHAELKQVALVGVATFVPFALRERLKQMAKEDGRSLNKYLALVLREHVKEKKKNEENSF